MKYSQFEENLKSKLYNNVASVDTTALIANIHSLDSHKNRKKPLVLFLAAFAIIALSFSLFDFNQNETNNQLIPIAKKEAVKEKRNTHKQITPANNIQNNTDSAGTSIYTSPMALQTKKNAKISSIHQNKTKGFSPNTSGINKIKHSATINNQISFTQAIQEKISGLKNTQSFNPPEEIGNIGVSLLHTPMVLKRKKLWGDPTGCYSFGPGYRMYWLLGIEAGLLKPFKSLRQKNNELNQVFDVRREHEKPLEGLQAAIFTKVIRDDIPFYLKLGVSYTRITDRLKYKYSYIEHDTIQGIISITKSENGDTVTVIYGDIIRDKNIERNISQHYYFHLIDIPLTLGYRFDFKGFGLEAELGAMFNIRTGTTGNILKAPNSIVPVKDSNLFRTAIGFSYFAGANIIIPVSYKGEMYASVRFRYIPNEFSLSDNVIKQNYSLAGFHIGYLYNLSKRSYD